MLGAKSARVFEAMSRVRLTLAFLIAVLVIASLPVAGLSAAGRAQSAQATVTALDGTVTVQTGASGALRAAVSGEAVGVGDRVLTGDPGRALLTFFDGSEQELGPNTEVLLQALGDSPGGGLLIQIAQASGVTVNRVAQLGQNSSYELQTPNTTAVVRGTVFDARIALDLDTRRVLSEEFSVVEGVVEVRLGQEVRTLNPGDQLRIVPSAGGGIETVGPAPVLEGAGGASAGGVLAAWGDTGFGRLGNGSNSFTLVAVQVNDLRNVTAISAGYFHSLAITADGNVWSWGGNGDGQLGSGDTEQRLSPTQVNGIGGAIGVAAGDGHSLAVRNDGTVWAWGSNYFGQRGDGSDTCFTCITTSPVQVVGLGSATAVAAGSQHSLALKSDGTVWAWGLDLAGQLGDGASNNISTVPMQVLGLDGVVAIAAGAGHSLALRNDGSVWAWGDSDFGQLGIGVSDQDTSIPIQVPGLSGITAIAADSYRSMALRNDGTVWSWGRNGSGQLGNGEASVGGCECIGTPVQASGLDGVIAIGAGSTHSAAARSDGTVWAWGANYTGQLGNDTLVDSSVPVQVLGLSGVSALDGGQSHTLALRR